MTREKKPVCTICNLLINPRQNVATRSPLRFWMPTRSVSTLRKVQPKRKILSSISKGTYKTDDHFVPLAGMNRKAPGDLVSLRLDRQGKKQRLANSARGTKSAPRKPDLRGGSKDSSKQHSLSQISYDHRNDVKNQISHIKNFDDFPLLPTILHSLYSEALRGMASITPTPIQRLAIPAILQDPPISERPSRSTTGGKSYKSYFLAAETGSGKTLAYLLPTINKMKQQENANKVNNEFGNFILESKRTAAMAKGPFELDSPLVFENTRKLQSSSESGRPQVIVLLPTAELVEQVGALFKMFSHSVKFRVVLLSASYSATTIRNRLFGDNGVDVVISTPHILSNIAESDPNVLSQVSHLIIDEADSLFDRSFSPLTSNIIDRSSPSLKTLIMCSATIPESLNGYLRKSFPEIIRLTTPNVHAIPRRVQLNVIDIERAPYLGNRDLACADTIWSIGRDMTTEPGSVPNSGASPSTSFKNIIVFVNKRETAPQVATYLQSKGINAHAMNRDTREGQTDKSLLQSFGVQHASLKFRAKIDAGIVNERPRTCEAAMLANAGVVVMTDIGSRGIDTLAVRHVILYDVPYTTIDFIHRIGRTGRMGRRGRAIALVGKDDRKDIVRDVREGMYRGQALA